MARIGDSPRFGGISGAENVSVEITSLAFRATWPDLDRSPTENGGLTPVC